MFYDNKPSIAGKSTTCVNHFSWRSNDNREVLWYKQCRTMTYDELEDPGSGGQFKSEGFARLDHLMMMSLPKIFPKKLKDELDRKMVKLYALNPPKIVMGRQCTSLMYDFFKTENTHETLYTAQHVMAIKFGGDSPEQLRALRDVWDQVWDECEEPPGPKSKESLWHALLKQSTVLKAGCEHYAREKVKVDQSNFKEDINYEYLRGFLDNHLWQCDFDENLAKQEAEIARLTAGLTAGNGKKK